MDETGPDPSAFKELRSATDLHATKSTAQAIGRSMASFGAGASLVKPHGDQGHGQDPLPQFPSDSHRPVRILCRWLRGTLHHSTEVVASHAPLPAQAL